MPRPTGPGRWDRRALRVVWGLLLALAVTAAGCQPKLGSANAVGGRLYVQPLQPSQVSEAQVAAAAEVVGRRVRSLGVGRPEVRIEDKVIAVDNLPAEMAQQARWVCAQQGEIRFALVPDNYEPTSPDADPQGGWLDTTTGMAVGGGQVVEESERLFDGGDLVPRSTVKSNERSRWDVEFELRPERHRAVREVTAANEGRRMIVTCDGEVLVAPVIQSPIPARGAIRDIPTQDEAEALRALIESGPLPYEVRASTEATLDVGPPGESR